VRRSDFEAQVRRHLDATLGPRGFTLTPQPPADWEDTMPAAIYEADPKDYELHYPSLRARFNGEVSCIDIWIKSEAVTGRLLCELEGDDLPELLTELGAPAQAERLREVPFGTDVGEQLEEIAKALEYILDSFHRTTD
jgi:hypothetical protein